MIIVAGVKPPIEFLSTPKVCERNLDSIEKAIRGAQVPTWRKPNMQLRDHPLMTYRGNRSWPPAWLWTAGYETTHPQGEVGILKAVLRSHIQGPRHRKQNSDLLITHIRRSQNCHKRGFLQNGRNFFVHLSGAVRLRNHSARIFCL